MGGIGDLLGAELLVATGGADRIRLGEPPRRLHRPQRDCASNCVQAEPLICQWEGAALTAAAKNEAR